MPAAFCRRFRGGTSRTWTRITRGWGNRRIRAIAVAAWPRRTWYQSLPTSRPARERPAGLIRWSGYIDGRFFANDLTPNVLSTTAIVDTDDRYRQYMLMPWTPLLLEGTVTAGRGAVTVDAGVFETVGGGTAPAGRGTVRQRHYGINEIEYEVSLSRPQLLVENEMYFPGWRARLATPIGDAIEAVPVNGAFRGWRLPAGTYRMTASFTMPYLRALRACALGSLAVWLVALAFSRFSRRGRATLPLDVPAQP